jgi:hypothetical protein
MPMEPKSPEEIKKYFNILEGTFKSKLKLENMRLQFNTDFYADSELNVKCVEEMVADSEKR